VHSLLGGTGLFPTVLTNLESVKERKKERREESICKVASNHQKMGIEPISKMLCISDILQTTDNIQFICIISLPLSQMFRESSFILAEILNSTDNSVFLYKCKLHPSYEGNQGHSSNIHRF
jgi:hypothetical protein